MQSCLRVVCTKWTLHKTELLSLLVKKVDIRLSQVYTDPVVQGHSMLTIRKHLEDVTGLTQHINLLMRDATPSQENVFCTDGVVKKNKAP